jgi:hypothetical protein
MKLILPLIILSSGALFQVHADTPAPADALPPGVTAEMEKDFLARYEAVMISAKVAKDPSGLASYYALFAMDPAVPPEGKKAFEDLSIIAIAMDASGGKPTYSFVSVPPDEKSNDAPLTLAGKVYTGYLPPVVELKTTFAPPDHPDPNGMTSTGSTHPLCVENGRLMLIGIKPVPGAVPPPADNPADNFGLTPQHLKQGDTDDDNDFASLDKFLAALKQPSVQVLDSGENLDEYYAICRVRPDLFVFVHGSRPGKENYSYTFLVTDSNQTQIKVGSKQITLAEDPPGLDGKPIPILQGDVYQPSAGYAGPITLLGKYGITSDPKAPDPSDPKFSFTKTVDWK